jgi:hypothetical protein
VLDDDASRSATRSPSPAAALEPTAAGDGEDLGVPAARGGPRLLIPVNDR